MANSRAEEFIRHTEDLPVLTHKLQLTAPGTEAVDRCIDTLRCLMRGNHDLGFTMTSRYQKTAGRPHP
ncbi:hypothetical protein ACWCPF_41940 [Streptomyces sp. NPDC001858]